MGSDMSCSMTSTCGSLCVDANTSMWWYLCIHRVCGCIPLLRSMAVMGGKTLDQQLDILKAQHKKHSRAVRAKQQQERREAKLNAQ